MTQQPDTPTQAHVRRGMWATHNDVIQIQDMIDEHLLNAYKTCVRHRNYDKANELIKEIEHRNIDGRI